MESTSFAGAVFFGCAVLHPIIVSASAAPKIISQGAYAPAGTRQFVLHSQRLRRDFVIVVSTPSGPFVQPGRTLPAIYILDGGYGIAGPIAQMMAWAGSMSPAYVVSVSYPKSQESNRDTDLLYRPVTRDGVTAGGGGADFEAFLTEELRPFLEARYPLDPDKAILFGHSYAGLFAANVLAESPDAFSGYVIASPSVWADPQLLAQLPKSAPKGKGRRVYIAAGEKEDIEGSQKPSMLEGAGQIASILAAPNSTFRVEKQVFAGENHISYWPRLVPASFVWILPPPIAGPFQRTAIKMAAADLERFVGVYAIADGRTVTIRRNDAQLFAGLTGSPEGEILAETPQRFFAPVAGYDISLTFEGAAPGPSPALVFSINGTETRAVRKTQ
jgi:predicted alpha/beta superfamily hydrolase